MVQAKFTSEMIDCLRKLIGESFVSYDGAIMNQTAYGNLQLNTCLLYTSPSPRDS